MAESIRRIPVSQPTVTEQDIAAVLDCLDKNFLSGDSPVVAEFESSFSSVVGRKSGIAVANGSVALDVVLHALQLQPGDEVILPSFTIASCLFAVLRTGAKPVFVDVEDGTWNMSLNTVQDKVTAKTRVLMIVHVYGLPVDMDPIVQFCLKNEIVIIEDAAEAHGVRYRGQMCGSFGLASTFSFYANKAITAGEGGMVLTDDDDFRDKIRYLRNLAFAPPPGKRFIHSDLGWNLRLSSMQAALANSQLKRLDVITDRKREIGLAYHSMLSGDDRFSMQLTETDYAKNMYWVFGVVFDAIIDADAIAADLKLMGIETRPFFFPLHQQPVLQKFALGRQQPLPVSEKLGKQGIYLPSYIGMDGSDIDFVIDKFTRVLGTTKKL
jgi:perosamine synthetase